MRIATRDPKVINSNFLTITSSKMAPFRGKISGGARDKQRAIQKIPGRGKPRATGGNNRQPRAGKNTFYSTRVEEQQVDVLSKDSDNTAFDDADDVQESSDHSIDSDEDTQTGIVQSYSTLLQSLKANTQYDEPPRKRRKLHSNEPSCEGLHLNESDLDQVDELEDKKDEDGELMDLDETVEKHDPFNEHLSEIEEGHLQLQIQAVKENKWSMKKLSNHSDWSHSVKFPATPNLGGEPRTGFVSNTQDLMLKHKLISSARKILPAFDALNGSLAFSMFNYHDLLFSSRTLENETSLRKISCLHALNHIFKTRDKVIKNNGRLASEDVGADVECRDQGFTRPKVLILLPTRASCVKYVETLVSLCEPEQQENKKRFQDSYAGGEPASQDKPSDFRALFDGNDDDMFRLGLKFTRKTIKYFAQFYNSDIIFASPLGLRMALGGDDPKKQDSDFLSSIELLIIDQADAMLMQNWEHVEHIFERLNLQPKEAHGCDFSRVRNWYLDGNAKFFRQTIVFSAFNFPSLNRLYTRQMMNIAGKVKYTRVEDGAIIDLGVTVKQTFSRFNFGDPAAEPDNRFNYFTTAIVPTLPKLSRNRATEGPGILIYIPSYADFVRVRNYLATSTATQHISFASISEYSPVRDIARARSHFLSSRHSVLLYTERAHHFRRYRLKGVKKIIMYGLPENPIFYKEITGGYLGDSIAATRLNATEASVRALFSHLDVLKLERIVGTRRYLSMLKDKGGDTFDFI